MQSTARPLTQRQSPASRPVDAALARAFTEHGYLTIPGVVDPDAITKLSAALIEEYERLRRFGMLFAGGGTVSGHLNCFPGAGSRFVYQALAERGILELVPQLWPDATGRPNIGCNVNLPGSSEQNDHVDGDPAHPFLIVNVAAVDTTIENGAMEILCGTHRSTHEYWRLLLTQPERRRVSLQRGDILIRLSTLWHRGMPNRSASPRPMLAFTWEDGGSRLDDPYSVHEGRLAFLPNRYGSDWGSRLREQAFAAAPRAGTAYLAVRSFLSRRTSS